MEGENERVGRRGEEEKRREEGEENEAEGTHVGRVDLALNDVEDRDVARCAVRHRGRGGDHAVLGLEKSAHDVEHGGLADRFGLRRDLVSKTHRGRGRRDEPDQSCRS